MDKKRVVTIDDSTVMRALVRKQLEDDGRFDIVGEAADPYEAREVIKRTNPDVLILDVEMPRMDGLSFLEKVMRLRPLPVVMFSTETHTGSVAAVEALSLGAVDCVGKPTASAPDTMRKLAERVFVAATARIPGRNVQRNLPPAEYYWNGKVVLIGASTGGVDALERLLDGFPENCPPTLIAQHMPESFLVSFADRLTKRVRPDVRLATDGETLKQGMVRIAPGGDCHLNLLKRGSSTACMLKAGERVSGHRPSVDALYQSAMHCAEQVVAVILTGMGRDGAQGMLDLRKAGAATIAQDQDSCVVYGMPRVATEIGGAIQSLALDKIPHAILNATGRKQRAATQPGVGNR